MVPEEEQESTQLRYASGLHSEWVCGRLTDAGRSVGPLSSSLPVLSESPDTLPHPSLFSAAKLTILPASVPGLYRMLSGGELLFSTTCAVSGHSKESLQTGHVARPLSSELTASAH